jgi:PAS domain S-box-containing protein
MIQGEQILMTDGPMPAGKKSQSERGRHSKSPSLGFAMFLVCLSVAAALATQIWPHASSLPGPLVESCTLLSILVAVVGVTLLFLLRGYSSRWQSLLAQQRVDARTEAEALVEDLRRELEVKTHSESSLTIRHETLRSELATLKRANESQSEELSRLREEQKSMAEQRYELARTKSVLELHVQARTYELEKLQHRYELILNAAGEGICGLNAEGEISFVNPTAARTMAWNVESLIGLPASRIFPVQPPSSTSNTDPEHAPNGQLREVVWKRADGSRFIAEYLRSPIHEGTRFVGEVLLFKDITERKKAAEALAQKAEELARSNAELEQFAFVASHDLQEPLRKIQAFGDRLKTKCDAAKLQDGREYLDRMQSAAARMQTLINDLLTFSRIISRNQPFVPVNLQELTREVLSDLELRIEKSGAIVEVGDLPEIDGDATQMRQLLQNLISNALKFHKPESQPKVRIQHRILDVPARPGRDNNGNDNTQFCELSIKDNGIGFEEKHLDKIFAVFQRLHGRQEYEGTGIGLAVCRRIVERHGGALTAKSQPAQGATFIATLPLRHSVSAQTTSA